MIQPNPHDPFGICHNNFVRMFSVPIALCDRQATGAKRHELHCHANSDDRPAGFVSPIHLRQKRIANDVRFRWLDVLFVRKSYASASDKMARRVNKLNTRTFRIGCEIVHNPAIAAADSGALETVITTLLNNDCAATAHKVHFILDEADRTIELTSADNRHALTACGS